MSRYSLLPLSITLATLAGPALAIPLHFDNPVSSTDGTSILGGVIKSTTTDFLSVGTEDGVTVDMRVSAELKTQTTFGADAPRRATAGDAGYIPNYNAADAEPNNDLGFLFYGHRVNDIENGIVLTFEFFDGTGDLSGTFANPFTVSELDFAIYDVDGETSGQGTGSTQSEFFTATIADGLVGYSIGVSAHSLTPVLSEAEDTILFDGKDLNVDESNAEGAVRLLYKQTDSFTLDFGSVMSSGSGVNPVFAAFDGDLSLFDITDFGPMVSLVEAQTAAAPAVPLPGSIGLTLTGLAGLALIRRRKRG